MTLDPIAASQQVLALAKQSSDKRIVQILEDAAMKLQSFDITDLPEITAVQFIEWGGATLNKVSVIKGYRQHTGASLESGCLMTDRAFNTLYRPALDTLARNGALSSEDHEDIKASL